MEIYQAQSNTCYIVVGGNKLKNKKWDRRYSFRKAI